MNREEIYARLAKSFETVFGASPATLNDQTTARDVEGWDSVSHIDMICEIEDGFGITFTTGEVAGLENVGQLVNLIESKQATK